MKRLLVATIAAVALIGLVRGPQPLAGQEKPATEKAGPSQVPLKVTVVIGRYQGEKRTGNLPFVLSLSTAGSTQVQMGASVPVPSTETSKPFEYRSVGTNIRCSSPAYQGEGRYRLSLQLTDNQIFLDAPGGIKGIPAFQNFTLNNDVTMRDGETVTLGTAVDKATGETIRVDVTLNVIK